MVITERQKTEFENLMENANKEQAESVVAYGADLYRQGLITGAITGAIGFGIGVVISVSIREIKKIKKTRHK